MAKVKSISGEKTVSGAFEQKLIRTLRDGLGVAGIPAEVDLERIKGTSSGAFMLHRRRLKSSAPQNARTWFGGSSASRSRKRIN